MQYHILTYHERKYLLNLNRKYTKGFIRRIRLTEKRSIVFIWHVHNNNNNNNSFFPKLKLVNLCCERSVKVDNQSLPERRITNVFTA